MTSQEENTKLKIITALAATQIILESMDELAQTEHYRNTFKNASLRYEKEISKVCDNDLAVAWGIDEETMQEIQTGIELVAKELASLNPVRIALLGQSLKDGSLSFVDNNNKNESET